MMSRTEYTRWLTKELRAALPSIVVLPHDGMLFLPDLSASVPKHGTSWFSVHDATTWGVCKPRYREFPQPNNEILQRLAQCGPAFYVVFTGGGIKLKHCRMMIVDPVTLRQACDNGMEIWARRGTLETDMALLLALLQGGTITNNWRLEGGV